METRAARRSVVMTASTFPRSLTDDRPTFVLELAQSLSTRWMVTVLAPHEPGAARRERLGEVEVVRYRYRVPGLRALTAGGGILASIRAYPMGALQVPLFLASQAAALRRACARLSPALIHAHWIVPQGTIAALAGAATIPRLGTAHGGDIWALRRGRTSAVLRWTLGRLQLVTAVSSALRDAVVEIAPSLAVEVAPMGVDTRLFAPTAELTGPDPWPQGVGLRLLFVGRLVEKKGVAVLLAALAKGREEDHRLVVAGDGPLRRQLEVQVRDLGLGERVRFLGAIPHRSLPPLYASADLFVGPSITAEDGDSEGLGLVFAEALSSGTPVVASDLAAIRDVVRDAETGITFPAGDADALAESIRRLAGPNLRSELAARARASVVTTMSTAIIADRYDALYRRLVSD